MNNTTKQINLQDALLSEAFINGRRVALQGLPSSSVQGRPGSPEYDEGMRGWLSGFRELTYDDAMRCAA